jgi:hypothetical protein
MQTAPAIDLFPRQKRKAFHARDFLGHAINFRLTAGTELGSQSADTIKLNFIR